MRQFILPEIITKFVFVLSLMSSMAIADHIEEKNYKLNPRFEGMYDIHIRCERPSPSCSHQKLEPWDRLVIVDSRLSMGTWLTFASTKHGEIKDRYFNSKIGPQGDSLVAVPRFGSGAIIMFAYIELHLDHQNGNLEGSIIAQDSLIKYHITGKPRASGFTLPRWDSPVDLPAAKLEGIYHGSLGKFPGRLVVKSLPNGHAVGHFDSFQEIAPDVPLLELDFHSGDWEREIGVLILTMQLKNFAGQGVLALAFQGFKDGKLQLKGFQAAGPKTNQVTFVREVMHDD